MNNPHQEMQILLSTHFLCFRNDILLKGYPIYSGFTEPSAFKAKCDFPISQAISTWSKIKVKWHLVSMLGFNTEELK